MMDSVEILPGFHAVGLTLHVPEHEALAFADLHLGFEEALNRQGVLVPRFQYADIEAQLREALDKTRPRTVIIDGDLKHEFGPVSPREWAEVVRFLGEVGDYESVLVRGNHDRVIGPVAGRVRVVESLKLGTTLFVHGHEVPKEIKGVRTLVVGHEHPCISLREEGRIEKVKCFLVGRWKSRNLIVLPSMNFVTEGTDVLTERPLSPLLQEDIGKFKAYGVDKGEILYFGRLEEI
ncbi:MAG: metallophosphoesterase [Candidatus Altiarchaeota archaeon]